MQNLEKPESSTTFEGNQQRVIDIANRHLGQKGGEGYSVLYDPTLLVRIPRYLNREAYGIKNDNLPFVGYDTWNAYEISAITQKGLPIAGMVKISYSASSEYHVESKSLKLYLNSFNMTPMGQTAVECRREVEQLIEEDLRKLLEVDVMVTLFTDENQGPEYELTDFNDIRYLIDLDEIDFTSYKSDKGQLDVAGYAEDGIQVRIKSNLLRSNCRVTNQPDWGDIFIHLKGNSIPLLSSIAKYIVSHRTVSHFHEEICEMVYAHLLEAYEPEELMVACLYTRRGGIDINPIRATHNTLIPSFFIAGNVRIKKTLRQ